MRTPAPTRWNIPALAVTLLLALMAGVCRPSPKDVTEQYLSAKAQGDGAKAHGMVIPEVLRTQPDVTLAGGLPRTEVMDSLRRSRYYISTTAERFYKERPSLLRRVLPFSLAVWFERWLFILLPLLAVAVPAFAYLPKIYDWRIRSKLDGWYVEVNRIERVAAERGENAAAQLARMNEIDSRLNRVKVPKAYLAQLYTLRQHADYVRGLLLARQGEVGSS